MSSFKSFVPVNQSEHLIKGFNCGKAEMNSFLSRFAIKHAKLIPLDAGWNKNVDRVIMTPLIANATNGEKAFLVSENQLYLNALFVDCSGKN